ncbi:Peptidase-M13 domain-containing protein [Aphelenchoides bicaudatus]|nr:Peptidase-M13 domain-containing protein [Aphelenchoides bicaudatus]
MDLKTIICRQQCKLSSQNLEPQTSKNVKGDKTIDENILDNAAIKASFLAYKEELKKQGTSAETDHVSGYSKYTPEQVFYIAYGMSMCSAVTKDYLEHLINEGDFSPKVFRVNTVLQNDPNFCVNV